MRERGRVRAACVHCAQRSRLRRPLVTYASFYILGRSPKPSMLTGPSDCSARSPCLLLPLGRPAGNRIGGLQPPRLAIRGGPPPDGACIAGGGRQGAKGPAHPAPASPGRVVEGRQRAARRQGPCRSRAGSSRAELSPAWPTADYGEPAAVSASVMSSQKSLVAPADRGPPGARGLPSPEPCQTGQYGRSRGKNACRGGRPRTSAGVTASAMA